MSFLTSSANPVVRSLVPIFAATYALQTLVAVPSVINQTEHFYDLAGSCGFMASLALSVYLPASRNPAGLLAGVKAIGPRGLLLTGMTALWAGRLGFFLYRRIQNHPDKKDSRFDEIKKSPPKFFGAWMGQATWISVVALPVYIVNSIPKQPRLGLLDGLGIAIWTIALYLENKADQQKSQWRRDQKKHGEKFITSGLWAYSRHPNYVGEVSLWAGIYLLALPALRAASHGSTFAKPILPKWAVGAALISPIFEYLLITKASGVPLLEEASDKKYGGDPAYEKYKKNTPVFFPIPGKHA